MKKSSATIYDIAKKLNIAASTVSRALQNSPKISERVRKLVVETAQQMNYQRNNIAVSLKHGKINIIGVIVPSIHHNFFSSVISGIEEVASRTGYGVLICQSNDKLKAEKTALNMFSNGTIDGLLVSVAAEKTDYSHFEEIEKRGIPIVFFDRYPIQAKRKVMIDDYEAAKEVVAHLLAQGCRKIVHFSGYLHVSVWQKRQQGYLDAMKERGIEVPPKWIFEEALTETDGEKIAQKLFAEQQIPDAIFASSDYAALGAMAYFKSKNIRIPGQVAIVGFANEPVTSYVTPSLSSVDQHSYEMGKKAAQQLLTVIDGKDSENTQIIPHDLIIRKSSSRK